MLRGVEHQAHLVTLHQLTSLQHSTVQYSTVQYSNTAQTTHMVELEKAIATLLRLFERWKPTIDAFLDILLQ